MAVSAWSVSALSALYLNEKSSLVAHARRILRSDAEANEVVQEAFLKFILAAPELDSQERALAYLRASVTNLSLNQIRAKGSRPNLVAIDAETSQDRINELSIENYVSIDASLIAAEDASIVREALSRMSANQRTALVMWEVEGRSTDEIAKELGTSESNVRHIVTRARRSFVRVLNEWILDESTGLTALDALSSSYKKAGELAKKSSKVALSFLIVLVAFLGFNSITGTELSNVSNQVLTSSAAVNSNPPKSGPANSDTPNTEISSKIGGNSSGLSSKITRSIFAGTDKSGIPLGFTVADASGNLGSVNVSSQILTQLPDGFSLTSNAMSNSTSALNVLLAQSVNFNASGISYVVTPAVTINGVWFTLDLTSTDSNYVRLIDGTYLVVADLKVNSTLETAIYLESKTGLSVASIPDKMQTSILIDSNKSRILAQAIFVNAKTVK